MLTGRAKEMIISRGANYYCYEIEDIVTSVSGTVAARVAATSVHDELLGTEVLCLFFVPASPEGIEQLHEHGVLGKRLRRLIVSVRSQVAGAKRREGVTGGVEVEVVGGGGVI